MKQYIEINHEQFEVSHAKKFFEHVNSSNYHHKSLYKCYTRPSSSKVRIYERWFTWFDVTKDNTETWEYQQTFGVRTFNTFMITLGMTIRVNGQWYYIVITPSRKIAFELH